MNIKIINKSTNANPEYETAKSAGMDIRAFIDSPGRIIIEPGKKIIINTGLYLELPDGVEMQVRSRSGLAAKSGITVLNSPGTIDPDYRGEIKVILFNSGDDKFIVYDGDRIAQMVFARYEHVRLDNVENLSETDRGDSGLGSTGIK